MLLWLEVFGVHAMQQNWVWCLIERKKPLPVIVIVLVIGVRIVLVQRVVLLMGVLGHLLHGEHRCAPCVWMQQECGREKGVWVVYHDCTFVLDLIL